MPSLDFCTAQDISSSSTMNIAEDITHQNQQPLVLLPLVLLQPPQPVVQQKFVLVLRVEVSWHFPVPRLETLGSPSWSC